jgi:hypothetical protein
MTDALTAVNEYGSRPVFVDKAPILLAPGVYFTSALR